MGFVGFEVNSSVAIGLVAMGFYFYFDERVLILRLMDFFF